MAPIRRCVEFVLAGVALFLQLPIFDVQRPNSTVTTRAVNRSIYAWSQSRARLNALEGKVDRLATAIDAIGRHLGVTPAYGSAFAGVGEPATLRP
jgi:hypothetical protein